MLVQNSMLKTNMTPKNLLRCSLCGALCHFWCSVFSPKKSLDACINIMQIWTKSIEKPNFVIKEEIYKKTENEIVNVNVNCVFTIFSIATSEFNHYCILLLFWFIIVLYLYLHPLFSCVHWLVGPSVCPLVGWTISWSVGPLTSSFQSCILLFWGLLRPFTALAQLLATDVAVYPALFLYKTAFIFPI